MTDLDRLLHKYVKRFEAGGSADPSDLLEQAQGADRTRLSALIDGYLEHAAPAQEWDAEAFQSSVADRATAMVAGSWSAVSGDLPVKLVELRNQREIARANLVTRLADELGVGAKREKVAAYYHQLERGLLPAEGVSTRVFDALGELLGTTADSLRRAGTQMTTMADGQADAVFARKGWVDPQYAEANAAEPMAAAAPDPAPDWDEVDELFRGAK